MKDNHAELKEAVKTFKWACGKPVVQEAMARFQTSALDWFALSSLIDCKGKSIKVNISKCFSREPFCKVAIKKIEDNKVVELCTFEEFLHAIRPLLVNELSEMDRYQFESDIEYNNWIRLCAIHDYRTSCESTVICTFLVD